MSLKCHTKAKSSSVYLVFCLWSQLPPDSDDNDIIILTEICPIPQKCDSTHFCFTICHTWIERGLVSSQYHSPQHYNPFLVYNLLKLKYLYWLEIYCFAGQHHTLCVDFTRNELYLARNNYCWYFPCLLQICGNNMPLLQHEILVSDGLHY